MSDQLPTETQALERHEGDDSSQLAIRTLDDIRRVSLIFVKSGMFKGDDRATEEQKLYQAGVKIIAGKEFGIPPFAAMRGINIIKGNAEMSANLMAAKVKKHPKYDYRVAKWDRDGCVLDFFEYLPDGTKDKLGQSSFDAEDARLAGLAGGDNWRKFARNMYFARALSNGVRIYCPDIFYGAPVYTEGEIAGEFDAPSSTPAAEPNQADQPARNEAVEGEVVEAQERAAAEDSQESDVPAEVAGDVSQSDSFVDDDAATAGRYMSEGQRKKLMAIANAMELDKPTRLSIVGDAIQREIKSTNELTYNEADKAIEHLQDLQKQGSAA